MTEMYRVRTDKEMFQSVVVDYKLKMTIFAQKITC